MWLYTVLLALAYLKSLFMVPRVKILTLFYRFTPRFTLKTFNFLTVVVSSRIMNFLRNCWACLLVCMCACHTGNAAACAEASPSDRLLLPSQMCVAKCWVPGLHLLSFLVFALCYVSYLQLWHVFFKCSFWLHCYLHLVAPKVIFKKRLHKKSGQTDHMTTRPVSVGEGIKAEGQLTGGFISPEAVLGKELEVV